MRNYVLLILGIGGLAGLQVMTSEELVRENGTPTALTLPLDAESSTKVFETATFGLG